MPRLTKSVIGFTLFFALAFPAGAAPHGGWDASWSPDGAWIAFTAGSPHSIPNLWLVRPDGTGPRRMTSRGAHSPKWMADGKSIAFGSVRSGRPGFMSIDVSGAPDSERPLTVLPPGSQDPVWSPDGSLVAYAVPSADGAARDLKFARTQGGGSSGLTSSFWVREWAWSPDGGTVAFVVGKATGSSIWTVSLSDKEMRLLYKGFCRAPSYSPDGKRLALAVPDVRSGFKIVVIDLASGLDKRIGVTTFGGEKIIWSPDGTRLFFASSRKSEPAVWSVEPNGRNLRRITPAGTACGSPTLSPDGSKFAFQAMQDDSYSPELFVCKVSGEGLARLARSSPSCYSPAWSPDGKAVAYQSDKEHFSQLFIGSAVGRPGKAVAQVFDRNYAEVAWTAGGNLVVADSGTLYTVRVGGGKYVLKPMSEGGSGAQSPSIASGQIYFTELHGANKGISAVKADGSGKRMLTNKLPDPPAPEKQAPPDKVQKEESGPTEGGEPSARKGAGPGSGQDSEGNPHSSLGMMGPMPDLKKDAQTPAVIDLLPAVSPDGKTVAFVRNAQVWLVDTDGQNERQLTQSPSSDGPPKQAALGLRWAPNGNRLIYVSSEVSDDGLTISVWTLQRDDGKARLVYSEKAGSEYGFFYEGCTSPPCFTPDGSRIVLTSVSGSQPRVISVDAGGGSDLRELEPAPSSFAAMNASGKKLAYVDLSDDLERIRVLDLQSGKMTGPLFK